ncbi:predicted protein [Histoplasma capsulatum H143]|uniref:Uncharacterized protein n=1 Tax=Ajellomyces capsulatus (strain H143) TaxID=544712 RepID=C6H8W4_AJECH|nr:predicted protein [Histoplasma capsulatum H143]
MDAKAYSSLNEVGDNQELKLTELLIESLQILHTKKNYGNETAVQTLDQAYTQEHQCRMKAEMELEYEQKRRTGLQTVYIQEQQLHQEAEAKLENEKRHSNELHTQLNHVWHVLQSITGENLLENAVEQKQ